MRSAVGRGIEPVPSSGGALRVQFHVNKEKEKTSNNAKNFGKDLVAELQKKISDL